MDEAFLRLAQLSAWCPPFLAYLVAKLPVNIHDLSDGRGTDCMSLGSQRSTELTWKFTVRRYDAVSNQFHSFPSLAEVKILKSRYDNTCVRVEDFDQAHFFSRVPHSSVLVCHPRSNS
jgi:hypothetical protein